LRLRAWGCDPGKTEGRAERGGVRMESWHSYPSIYNLGHKAIEELLTVPVIVEEKVDGSQFSFGLDTEGLRVRSKGCEMLPDAPEKMFQRGVDTVKELMPLLKPGWTYRGEYLMKPSHNTLVYSRIPNKHIILFDINRGHEDYLTPEEKAAEAARLGLECVPVIYQGMLNSLDKFREFLSTDSVLGGQKIEGVVVKPVGYGLFGRDKKCLMGKFVSEAFKESSGDILDRLGNDYTAQARWMKAVQHLKESGKIEDSPRDIGMLMKEIPDDIGKECAEEIKEKLYEWAWPHLRRMVTKGLPEWYKEQLLKKQFEPTNV
jgi:hypothetical protein